MKLKRKSKQEIKLKHWKPSFRKLTEFPEEYTNYPKSGDSRGIVIKKDIMLPKQEEVEEAEEEYIEDEEY